MCLQLYPASVSARQCYINWGNWGNKQDKSIDFNQNHDNSCDNVLEDRDIVSQSKNDDKQTTHSLPLLNVDFPDLIRLYAEINEIITFDVTLRDCYGNDCESNNMQKGYVVITICNNDKKILENSNKDIIATIADKDEKRDKCLNLVLKFTESTEGVFHCQIPPISVVGEYVLMVFYKDDVDIKYDINSLIEQSIITIENNDDKKCPSNTMIHVNENVTINDLEKELMLKKASNLEMTRKRAQDALQRHHADISRKNEEKRRNQAIKRTGGGFTIQYSKEI